MTASLAYVNVKVLFTLLICSVAVLGEERKMSEKQKRWSEMMEEYTKACAREMNLDPHLMGNPGVIKPNQRSCLIACVEKKLGFMNKDGSYNFERAVSLIAETPEDRKRMEIAFNNDKMNKCKLLVGDPCRVAACVHGIPWDTRARDDDDD